jgi:hypothetical protein
MPHLARRDEGVDGEAAAGAVDDERLVAAVHKRLHRHVQRRGQRVRHVLCEREGSDELADQGELPLVVGLGRELHHGQRLGAEQHAHDLCGVDERLWERHAGVVKVAAAKRRRKKNGAGERG